MKGKKPKIPEKATAEKVQYYKGVNKALEKEVKNLKKRVEELEMKMLRIYTNPTRYSRVEPDDEREAVLKKFNPTYKDNK